MSRPPTALAWRLAGILAMGLFAFAVVGRATDRLSAVKPQWEEVVPWPMADNAWRARAFLALQRGDSVAAVAAGEVAIRRGPMEPGSPDLLGSALLLANRPEDAERAFRVARQLGWRRAATQTYWMKQALAHGDWAAATVRLDALLRKTPALAGDAATLGPFEASSAGRAALVARLSTPVPWAESYAKLVDGLPTQQLAARAVVLRGLAAAGHPLGCPPAGPIVSALVARNLPAEADAIWRGHCRGAAAGILGDGTFANADLARRDSPFAWWVPPASEVSTWLDLSAAVGQPHLVVASSASFPRDVVNRMVYLPAGVYQLSWQALAEDGRTSDRIDVVVGCQSGSDGPLPTKIDPHSGRIVAEVHANDACPVPWLSFRIRPGTGEVRFGNVVLSALH